MRQQPLEDLDLADKALVAALGGLLRLVDAALAHLHIGKNQLEIDDVNVAQGVGAALNVGDVRVVKAAHNMDDRIGCADVGEELVAQALALGCPLDQARDIDKFDHGRSKFFGVVLVAQPFQPLVRHGLDAHIGVDGAKCVVIRGNARVGDGVKESRLADIWQSDDTELHGSASFSLNL